MDRFLNIFVVRLFIILVIFNILTIVLGEGNVALGKRTSQSSSYLSGNSSLAVDGNADSNYNHGSCSHTDNNGTNWWCVDLERAVDFHNIKIYNRNSHRERLQGFELRLSSTSKCNLNGYQQSTVCYKDHDTTTQDIYTINSCNEPNTVQFNGRYVYISVENSDGGDKYLTLCEVEVFERTSVQCASNCKDGCNSNGVCNQCISGYYDDKCSTSCSKKCGKNGGCQQGNGHCNNGCKPGYRGNTCNTRCQTNCDQCQQTNGVCTKCKPGYWGSQCRRPCRQCNNGCEKSNGNCIGGCKKRYIWGLKCDYKCHNCYQGCQQINGYCNSGGCITGHYGDKCYTPCPRNCKGSCIQDNGNCITCNDGYWGVQCRTRCPTKCKQIKCNMNNGYCSSCNNYYWGDKCEKRCSTNCKNHHSITCIKSSGKCNSGCKDTWYGDTCDNRCSSHCKQTQCNQQQSTPTCTSGCIDGYEGSYCQDTCQENCTSCNRYNNQCTSCKTGWYGDQCQTKCNSNCSNGCDQSTGKCTRCKDGYYGQICSMLCPVYCTNNCDQDSGHCQSCRSGTFGNYCNETCSSGCLPGKDQSTCDRNGRCSIGCINGRFGINCDAKCSTGCKNGTCNRNGSCISGCIPGKSGYNCTEDCSENCSVCNQYNVKHCLQCYDGYYGYSCEKPCSINCQSKIINPVCNKTNGYCTNGCTKGYYGDVCNKKCSNNCFEKRCNKNNGLCSNGCVAGKLGDDCTRDCSEGTYGIRCNSTCGNCYNNSICNIVSGSCGLAGCQSGFQGPMCKSVVVEETSNSSTIIAVIFVILVVIVVIGAVLLKRRKLQKKDPASKIRSDIVLSPRNRIRENVSKSDKLQYNSLSGNNSNSNNFESYDDNEQQIYQNVAIVNSTLSTSIYVPDLWDYTTQNIDQLTEQYQNLPKGLCRPHAICLNDINGPKNRYKNVCAFDDTRVKLEPIDNDPNTDYINACYITMYGQSSKYIASQGPNEVNIEEFIRMIWDVDASKIVMLTSLVENAIEKCKKYWPDVGKTQQFGQINMKLIKEDVFAHFTIREIQINKAESSPRIFRQYHYTSWPDKGVPSDIASLVEFRNKVNKSSSRRPGPMIVHCSAGIGRTGTFLALDYLIQQAQAENSVDIFSCVSQMRQERVNMVQTLDQYILLHDALTEWYVAGDTITSVTNYPELYNQLLKPDKHATTSQLQVKYQLMNKISCKIDKDGYSVALLPENKNKNRDQHVLAANSTRVMLVRTAYENSSDYINAVYLPSYKKKRGYISTQTPLPNTVEDFWHMVLHSESKVVISLDDKKTKNIGDYLPVTEINFGEMTIKREHEEKNSNGYYDVIFCQISRATDNIYRTVKVYQCHFWKGQNKIPESSLSIFTLLEEISSRNDSGPLVVNCLNGAYKSGLFCTLAAILERLTIEQDVSIIQTILQLRISRPEIISSYKTFKFCFDAVGVYLDYFANYANSC